MIYARNSISYVKLISFENMFRSKSSSKEIFELTTTLPKYYNKLNYMEKISVTQMNDRFLFLNKINKITYKLLSFDKEKNLQYLCVRIMPNFEKFLNGDKESSQTLDESFKDVINYGQIFDLNPILFDRNNKGKLDYIQYGTMMVPPPYIKKLVDNVIKDKKLKTRVEKIYENIDFMYSKYNQPKVSQTVGNNRLKNNQCKKKPNTPRKNYTQAKKNVMPIESIGQQEIAEKVQDQTLVDILTIGVEKEFGDECYRVAERYKPMTVKEKIKTRPEIPAQADLVDDLQKVSSSDEPLDNIPEVTHYISGKLLTLFDSFWQSNAGFMYSDFKSLFVNLGGQIDESTGSSHVKLIYKNNEGNKIIGGTWRPHGKASEYGCESTKYLKKYLTECGLTPDHIKPRSDRLESE